VTVFDAAREVADAVLYEGYVLYPYRASDAKNRVRWQFGVLVPPAHSASDPSERSWSQTECLVEGPDPQLSIRLRFLQVQRRDVEVSTDQGFQQTAALEAGDAVYAPWDEAVEREVDVAASVADLLEQPSRVPFIVPGGRESELVRLPTGSVAGRLVRETQPLSGLLTMAAEQLPGPYGVVRVRLRVENRTESSTARTDRTEALPRSLVAAHTLLSLAGGRFISLLEPPEWARSLVAECQNIGTYPVLAGEPGQADLVLSAPIILYDHPRVAPESPTDFFDATEIDELLSLRTMTLTEAEKREARGTDRRSAALIDHVDTLPADVLDRLHGAVRYLRKTTDRAEPLETSWWDPGADPDVSPETDTLVVNGVTVGNGSSVRLRPGSRRTDAQDMFLAGRTATVAAVFFDVDGGSHLAVTLDDDELAEIQQAHGRFLYFAPDEVEPVEVGP
jgi:hypothetical protein